MRILLQQLSSGKFLGENGSWTDVESEAKAFYHFLEALVFARDYVQEPVGAYCVFREPSYNFSVYLHDNSGARDWDARINPMRHLGDMQRRVGAAGALADR